MHYFKKHCSRIFFFFLLLVFLGLYLQHMEVPKLGVELQAYSTAPAMPDLPVSVTCTAAHGNARSLIH